MFVRRKRSRGKHAYWLVENRRESSFVVQNVIAYLGTAKECASLEGAIAWLEGRLAEIPREAAAERVILRDRLRRLRKLQERKPSR